MEQQLWVEPVGRLIVARMRGRPTEQILADCQKRVMALAEHTDSQCVLYDMLEAEAPAFEVVWSQRRRDEQDGGDQLRRAIVVPDTKLAYIARLAFGGSDHRVFYSDIEAARKWLEDQTSPCAEAPLA